MAILEDDGEMRRLLAEVLRAQGYLVDVFPDGASWLNASIGNPDGSQTLRSWQVIISDIRMPGLSGLTVLRMAKVGSPSFPSVILITAFGDEETYAEARRLGAAAVLDKPFDLDDLVAKVREVAPL